MTIGPVLARNGSVLGQLWRTILGRSNANVQNGTGPLLAADIGPIVEPALGQHRASYGMFAGYCLPSGYCPIWRPLQ
jgi:hypothetical protein